MLSEPVLSSPLSYGIAGLLAGLLVSIVAWVTLWTRAKSAVLARRDLEEELAEERASLDAVRAERDGLSKEQLRLTSEVARLEERNAQGEARMGELRAVEQRFMEQFRALSAEALKSNNESFLNAAQHSFEALQARTVDQLAANEKQVLVALEPMRETLVRFQDHLQSIEKDRVGAYESLTQQVKSLAETNVQLRGETGQLMRALKNPQARGQWGELQLRRVVELAGMLEYCDFVEQVSVNDGKLRPDLVIKLPGDKCIVVDAKAPLSAYLDANDAVDEVSRAALMKAHARAIKDHGTQLGKKAYWEQFENSPEFVVLFMPGESFFAAALQQQPELIEQAVADKVLLATPTTLIALLKAVSFGWRQERMAANAAEVQRIGNELFERLAQLSGHFEDLGDRLKKSVDSFNSAAHTFEHRVAVSARRFKELGAVTGESKRSLEPLETITVTPRVVGLGN
jgi:DNA recombination protein RmuC